MCNTKPAMEFTGERFIPNKSPKRIEEDHIERYNFASRYVENRNVLDIACGVGYGSFILSHANARLVDGVDICRRSIDYAKTNYNASNINYGRLWDAP